MTTLDWQPLTEAAQLDELMALSHDHPVVIFKHSTRCSISVAAKARLERQWAGASKAGAKAYYLDLLKYRSVSDEVARRFGVVHQSPQAIVVKGGQVVANASHMAINLSDLLPA